MRKPYCPEHLCEMIEVSYARIWKCPLGDYQVDNITVVNTHNDLVAAYAPTNPEGIVQMEADVRTALGIDD